MNNCISKHRTKNQSDVIFRNVNKNREKKNVSKYFLVFVFEVQFKHVLNVDLSNIVNNEFIVQ